MAHNPLLGSRISLISKKNIRYEGTLYSINESDATVALQNVRAYGTEGRESSADGEAFVAPQDQVHPYLLFRGCDIKDLHVHESSSSTENAPPSDPAIVSSDEPPEIKNQKSIEKEEKTTSEEPASQPDENDEKEEKEDSAEKKATEATKPKPNRRKKNKPKQMVGSGASLLNRKARGVVEGSEGPDKDLEQDFDFESNLAEFTKDDDEEEDEGEESDGGAYSKDDFFDSISNDVTDRQSGVDNRLRGATERSLNTETFGATSLGHNRRRWRGGGRGGRGRGGRGRGRGRGRGGRRYGNGIPNSSN